MAIKGIVYIVHATEVVTYVYDDIETVITALRHLDNQNAPLKVEIEKAFLVAKD